MEYISSEEGTGLTAEKGERGANAETMTNETLNKIGGVILDACITVHRELGPGLLESAYVISLVRELYLREINTRVQVPVEMTYKETPLGKIYVIDILVENEIVLEIKAVERMEPVFKAQLITYLKLTNKKLGYLINFNVPLLKDGFLRIVNNF
ncbi:GxxExxY protein [Niabella hibiscisoli]|uniref:GxxExxY protein n=1 Tax=Niabella hibiscisoli TaxID=1825928 RepID=UPI001F0D7E3D|nr:GxxExxY protein [Niabella hibiscisoli]MCH5718148.1 GxxExxY protein [Niabella hibiscisoli]